MSFSKSLNRINIPEKTKRYVLDVVNPLLQDLVHVLIRDQPDNPVQYLFDYLRVHPDVHVIRESDDFMHNSLDGNSCGEPLDVPEETQYVQSAISSSRVSDPEDAQFVPKEYKHGLRGRAAVSAEAYGDWNKKAEFVPPVFPKSDEERARIRSLVSSSFLFTHVEAADLTTIVDAFELVHEPSGTTVIQEGDVGDFLCVVESGTLVCLKGSNEVRTCTAGDVVGELALLYNAPRAATVQAVTDCKLWRLDSRTFSSIVREGAARKRERYEEFLKQVDLLRSLGQYERSQVADALIAQEIRPNETIVQQGHEGDTFFILESGSANAFKNDTLVHTYTQPGDYFGELALLRDEPRAATIVASPETGCRVLTLNRAAFTRLLGDLEELSLKNYN